MNGVALTWALIHTRVDQLPENVLCRSASVEKRHLPSSQERTGIGLIDYPSRLPQLFGQMVEVNRKRLANYIFPSLCGVLMMSPFGIAP